VTFPNFLALRSRLNAHAFPRAPFVPLIVLLVLINSGVWALPTSTTDSVALKELCPVAAGNSWIACCLHDLGFPRECIVSIAPPGMCPGHYDLRPEEAMRLRAARVAFFFDFQRSLAERLQESALETTTVIVAPLPGLSVPSTYVDATKKIAGELAKMNPETSRMLNQKIREVASQMHAIEHVIRQEIASSRWHGCAVVASEHQAAFCRWLGLSVVATLPPSDAATPGKINDLIRLAQEKRVSVVVANLQEGVKTAETIAQQLNVPCVVFSNFPQMTEGEDSFAALVRRNVSALMSCEGGAR